MPVRTPGYVRPREGQVTAVSPLLAEGSDFWRSLPLGARLGGGLRSPPPLRILSSRFRTPLDAEGVGGPRLILPAVYMHAFRRFHRTREGVRGLRRSSPAARVARPRRGGARATRPIHRPGAERDATTRRQGEPRNGLRFDGSTPFRVSHPSRTRAGIQTIYVYVTLDRDVGL